MKHSTRSLRIYKELHGTAYPDNLIDTSSKRETAVLHRKCENTEQFRNSKNKKKDKYMNLIQHICCRAYQGVFRAALPFLPYREPEILHRCEGLPDTLKQHKIKKTLIVTDPGIVACGLITKITSVLAKEKISYSVYDQTSANPTVRNVEEALALYQKEHCQALLAIGGGSAMDAAKIMWVMYEHPEADFMDMAMRFLDIRKRVYTFPTMGEKAYFIAVPTSSGTGSEVTPFAVITDEKTGVKYPLADYALLPNMAIVDTDLMMTQPKGLTAASGIDALVHSLEAYASVMATDFTDGLALRAIQNIFTYLPACYDNGLNEPVAREKMANASTMAGMAFANAFLGVCHSMAHKLGAFHHLPHGVANAVLLTDVMRYNADPRPQKMGTFSQYAYPHTLERYAEVARFLGLSGNSDEELLEQLIAKIEALKERVGIKKTIRDYGVKEEDFLATLDEMVEQAFDDQCTGANPRYPLMSEIKAMYLKAYYGE